MHQGRLQIRSSLVAFASLDNSVVYVALTATISSRPTTAAKHHPIVLDLEREVLAGMLGLEVIWRFGVQKKTGVKLTEPCRDGAEISAQTPPKFGFAKSRPAFPDD
jgi:hypothetical protein